MKQRVFFEWNAGAWINSDHADFVKDLIGLINQYGPPDLVEVRNEGEKDKGEVTIKSKDTPAGKKIEISDSKGRVIGSQG